MKAREKWVSPVRAWSDCSDERRVLLEHAWSIGELAYKLTPTQRETHAKIRRWQRKQTDRVFALDSSRRWGKSALCLVLAVEDAMRNPGWRIVYCAPEYKMVTKLLLPLMAQLLIDCPPEMAPEWLKTEGLFRFPNGTRLELIGLDINPDGARGTGVDRVFLDEAAYFNNLEYLLQSVLYPQMLGRPHARIICASTPPISPSHYWSSELVVECISYGAHDRRTLEDADQYTVEEIEFFIQKAGGRKSTTCRREYFAEHVTDETMAIVPEFREVEADIVVAKTPPYWRDCYTSMDPGWKDLSAVLFGYWNFTEHCLYIEDEIAASRMTSAAVAEAIKRKELVLWDGVPRKAGDGFGVTTQPYLRVSDNDPRLLYDLAHEHKLAFVATQKDNLDQQINALRVAIADKRILIHPRCKMLVMHLKNGVWKNEARKVFAREGDDLGHYDLIAALMYMWRNVRRSKNPQPKAEEYIAGDLKKKRDLAGAEGSKWLRRAGRIFVR